MRVIGTAGHVDHGKSTLVHALTGINPDRLREEQEREMTIDLGFAWLTLPSGEAVGVVDVPGHKDFIENMLAGVGGIDAALFIVAADESIMPQTREHLAILDLLDVRAGVVALTKADLAESEEWLELVEAEVSEALEGTSLEDVPIIPVSARTGQGLDRLVATLQQVLEDVPQRPDRGRPRLSVDRVFTMSGFGTVVTGTLIDGSFEVGQEVEVLPQGLKTRIRGLQTHKRKVQRAVPGSRVAVNLGGVSTEDVRRGNLVVAPGWLKPTRLVDVLLDYLADAPRPLRHNTHVKFFSGAAEVMARVRLLGTEALPPGETGWVQLALDAPLPLVKGDRYIVRSLSPGYTLGGGTVVDPHPGRQHRRFRADVIRRLETLSRGTPAEILLQALERSGPVTLREAVERSGLGEAAGEALQAAVDAGDIVVLSGSAGAPNALLIARSTWTAVLDAMHAELAAYHARFPLRPGMPREALRSGLKLEPKLFNAAVARAAADGLVADEGATVRLSSHAVRFTPEQEQAVAALLARFRREPYATPSVKESAAAVGEEALAALLARGDLVQLSPEVLLLPGTLAQAVDRVRGHIERTGHLTLAEARDLFQTSRKYAQALLEYLDAQGVTRRVGDERVLRK